MYQVFIFYMNKGSRSLNERIDNMTIYCSMPLKSDLIKAYNVRMTQELHDLNFAKYLLQILHVQLRLINYFDGHLFDTVKTDIISL